MHPLGRYERRRENGYAGVNETSGPVDASVERDTRFEAICEQGNGFKQPTPPERAEIGDEPEHPADIRKARLH
jgi:hypothetical protein